MDPSEILEAVKSDPSNKVKLAVVDIDGVLRGKYVHREKFLSAAEGGFGFCNVVFGWDSADVCYDNARYTGWHTGYPDAEAKIDLATYRRVPWDNNVPFFLASFVDREGSPLAVCPRQTLARAVAKAHALGFEASFGLEFEWFNFIETPHSWADKHYVKPEPLSPGMFGYSMLRAGQNREYFNAIMDEMGAFDVPIEGLHTETGPGVYEAAILRGDAMTAADRSVLFKGGVKEIAHRFGIMPSFMAKWDASLPGCSGHMHQSLWKRGENAFFDAADVHHMSTTFKQYLAGQMALLPELLPMYAPTVNSYKRLVEGLWAPTLVTWGVDNRTVALRVIPGSAKSARLETRVGGADLNPYLGVAAALASGLYGIEKGLELPSEPVVGNGYLVESAPRLPRNLLEATERFEASEAARALFGDTFVDHFAKTRRWEWRQFQAAVTDWELRRYFEII